MRCTLGRPWDDPCRGCLQNGVILELFEHSGPVEAVQPSTSGYPSADSQYHNLHSVFGWIEMI